MRIHPLPSDAQGNGHALNHRVTTGASIPSDAHGNGHALKLLERERKRDRSRVGEGHFEGQRRRKCVPVFGGADGVAGSVEDSGEHPYRPQIWTIVGGSCLALLQTKPIVS